MRIRRLLGAAAAVLIVAGPWIGAAETPAEFRSPAAAEARLRNDVTYLASPELEGRGVTTRGIDLAADFIAAEFKKAGLKPGGPDSSYFQPFTLAGATLVGTPALTLLHADGRQVELKPGVQFEAIGMSGTGRLRGSLVFAGYGITSKDPAYDDYAGLDVEGKIVVILRTTPRTDNAHALGGNWRLRYGSLNEKLANAKTHKAAAVLLVNDRDTASDGDDLLNFGYHAATSGLNRLPDFPVVQVRRTVIEHLMGCNLEALERDTDRDMKPQGRAIDGWSARVDVEVTRGQIPAKNVIGVLEGSGPLADETVVVGAHYDHVGYGGQSSLARLKKMIIHHGADDNASGTTAMLEVARRFALTPRREGRRLVFMAFSGEEIGLLGSAYYVKNPTYPLDKTAVMINMDMVGRMVKDNATGKDKLTVYGTGSAKTFDAVMDGLNKKYAFQLRKVASGNGPSDQMSFYQKKVPVFFFFTNDHPDYHRPSDTADKINVAGMRRITDMVEELTEQMATVPEKPVYVQVASPGTGGPGAPSGPRLGIQPDYSDDGEGVLLNGVTEGAPAAKAGIKAGDRLIEIGGKKVQSLENYMVLMRTFKLGDTIDMVVQRGEKKEAVKVKVKLE